MKSDDPVGRGTYFVSRDFSDSKIIYIMQTCDSHVVSNDDHKLKKNELKFLEEKNRIKHKNILFFFVLVFLAVFLFGLILSVLNSNFICVFVFGFLILICLGVLISYFTRKPGNDDHAVLKLISDIANNFLGLFRR